MHPILANRLYVPEHLVDPDQLERFRHRWKEKTYQDVLDDEGLRVLNKNGRPKIRQKTIQHVIEAYREILTGRQHDWLGLPQGNRSLVRPWLRGVQDLRSVAPLGFRLRLNPEVQQDARWPDQRRCCQQWLRRGSGIIVGQTGSGKTILGIAGVVRLGLQTLIMSKRGEGEKHWEREFRLHTDIDQVEQDLGKRLIGPYNRKQGYPISIVTVQTFLHKIGYERLIQDQFRFGLVIPDEIHELVAPEFIRCLSLWAPLAWLGLTATIERPDHREFLAYQILGPVVAKLKADQMRPEVEFIETQFQVPDWMMGRKPYSRQWTWTKLLSMMSGREDRIALIVNAVIEDINNGRLVAVVGERTKLLHRIHSELQKLSYDAAYVDGTVPNWRRDQIYADVAKGVKYRCIVAGKVLDAMVSIKPLDCLHLVTPVAQRHRVLQIFGRTRRPDAGKPTPQVRYYVDRGGQLAGAYKKVMKVCEDEGWIIHRTAVALAARSSMSAWKAK